MSMSTDPAGTQASKTIASPRFCRMGPPACVLADDYKRELRTQEEAKMEGRVLLDSTA